MKARKNAPVPPLLPSDPRAPVAAAWHVSERDFDPYMTSVGWIDPEGRFYPLTGSAHPGHADFALAYYGGWDQIPYIQGGSYYEVKQALMLDGWVRVTNLSGVEARRRLNEAQKNTVAWLFALYFVRDPWTPHKVYLDTEDDEDLGGSYDRVIVIERWGTPELNEAMWSAVDRKSDWHTFARQNAGSRVLYHWGPQAPIPRTSRGVWDRMEARKGLTSEPKVYLTDTPWTVGAYMWGPDRKGKKKVRLYAFRVPEWVIAKAGGLRNPENENWKEVVIPASLWPHVTLLGSRHVGEAEFLRRCAFDIKADRRKAGLQAEAVRKYHHAKELERLRQEAELEAEFQRRLHKRKTRPRHRDRNAPGELLDFNDSHWFLMQAQFRSKKD